MSITTEINFHNVRDIKASTPGTLGAPLFLALTGQDFERCGVTIFLGDHDLAMRIAVAINGAVEHKCEPDPAHEEAHNAAVTAYDYRGSNR